MYSDKRFRSSGYQDELVKGGQGRSAGSIDGTAFMFGGAMMLLSLILVAAIAFLFFR